MDKSSGIGMTDNMRIGSLRIGDKERFEKAYRTARHATEKERYVALRLLSRGYLRKEVATLLNGSVSVMGNWVTRYHR